MKDLPYYGGTSLSIVYPIIGGSFPSVEGLPFNIKITIPNSNGSIVKAYVTHNFTLLSYAWIFLEGFGAQNALRENCFIGIGRDLESQSQN